MVLVHGEGQVREGMVDCAAARRLGAQQSTEGECVASHRLQTCSEGAQGWRQSHNKENGHIRSECIP